MPVEPLFPRWTNSVARASLALLVGVVIGIPAVLLWWQRTPNVTGQFFAAPQPIEFDHRHHVRDDGIDCLYCHAFAERSDYAGIPPTGTCVGCHAQIWNDSPLVAPILQSAAHGDAIVWERVHDLADYVFFDHSIHVNRGVGCETCHGRVDMMARVFKAAPMTMGWCVDCHMEPTAHLRPLDEITTMGFAPEDPLAVGLAVERALDVDPSTDCTACHR